MKIVKYVFVGGVAAVVDIGLFYLGAGAAGWNYLIVGTVSFTLATLVNYVISVRVVFQSGARFARNYEVVLVFLVSCAGLAINQGILYTCIGCPVAVEVFEGNTADPSTLVAQVNKCTS